MVDRSMKARDIVPGWPRGKSQRRCWPSAVDPNRPFNRIYFRESIDIRYLEDWEDEKTEQRRKAAMMEDWHAVERVGLRFSFEPDNFLQRHSRKQLRRWWDQTETDGR